MSEIPAAIIMACLYLVLGGYPLYRFIRAKRRATQIERWAKEHDIAGRSQPPEPTLVYTTDSGMLISYEEQA